MRAGGKSAFAEVRRKLPESLRQLFLAEQLVTLDIHGGKAGRIGHIAALHGVQLHVTRGVAAAAELFAGLTRCKLQLRHKQVQKRGFAHAGVTRKCGDAARKLRAQVVHAHAVRRRDEVAPNADAAVNVFQLRRIA